MVRELEDDDHKAFIHLDDEPIVEGHDPAGRLVVSSPPSSCTVTP